jgi:predicted DNA-binding transcriptional regulator YafY
VEQSAFKAKVDNEILAKLTLAIKAKSAVSVDYMSTRDGLTKREILPHAIAESGDGYLVRAYDRLHQEFGDFVLSAIRRAQSKIGPVFEKEVPSKDIQWNNLVQLELVAHPHNVKYPEALEVEYEMVQGVLRVTVRAALASQMLKQMSVDCSERRKLRGSSYKWWLKNRQALYGLPNLDLAPGYIDSK